MIGAVFPPPVALGFVPVYVAQGGWLGKRFHAVGLDAGEGRQAAGTLHAVRDGGE